jgi:hypothetical protein
MLRTRTNFHYDALMVEMRLRHPVLFRSSALAAKS